MYLYIIRMTSQVNEINDSFPVICIQEFANVKNVIDKTTKQVTRELDTTIFIAYDRVYDEFVLYGKRADPPKCKNSNFAPFSFRFVKTDDVYDFLKLSIDIKCPHSSYDVILYNYNNFPLDFNVTFDFLYNNMNYDYEIAGFTDITLDRPYIKHFLRMIRDLYNRTSDGTNVDYCYCVE
jgi:hypothetical protein